MNILRPERFQRQPSCVLLDLDDTLYAYAPAHAAGLAAAENFAVEALNITPREFHANFDDSRTELKHRLGGVASAHNRLLYFARTIERAGFSTQPLIALQMEQAYWRSFLFEATLFAEVADFLDDLRISGVPVVIVTDLTAQIQFRKVVHFGLDRYVDWIVTSEESGADKPAAVNFELALAKLGGIEGAVWMIGEQEQADLIGAREAVDAVCIQKRHAGVKPAADADAHFSEFGELRRLLARLPALAGG
jgi:putative hydrolase of the HAD superfamily